MFSIGIGTGFTCADNRTGMGKGLLPGCSLHCFASLATSGMWEKVTCQVHITLIKESANVVTVLTFALASCTFKYMTTMVSFLEEYMDW